MGLGLAVESVFVLTVVIFVASHLHQGNGHVQNRSFHRLFGRWSISYAHLWHDIVDRGAREPSYSRVGSNSVRVAWSTTWLKLELTEFEPSFE